MILEARSPSCFSDHYVLHLDGRPHGEFRGRWFSEGVDIRLTNRRRLHLEKTSWSGSRFTLTDGSNGKLLAEASRSGVFTSSWDVQLGEGPAELVSAGVFNTGFNVVQRGRNVAEVSQIGICEGGWCVRANQSLGESDLIFIGLIYHTIVRRRAAAAAAAS